MRCKLIVRKQKRYSIVLNLAAWNSNCGVETRRLILTKHQPPHENLGEWKSPSWGINQKCAPHERSPCAPKFEDRSHGETLTQERWARRAAVNVVKNIYRFENSDQATFYVPGEVKGMSTPITAKRPEERTFVVDSRASIHMMSKKRIKLTRDGHSENVQNSLLWHSLPMEKCTPTRSNKCSFMTWISS